MGDAVPLARPMRVPPLAVLAPDQPHLHTVLLDLNRALRSHDGLARDKAALARLAGLRAKLDANRAVLKTHLDAVREVANVLADAIRDTESDGTYSPGFRSGGWE